MAARVPFVAWFVGFAVLACGPANVSKPALVTVAVIFAATVCAVVSTPGGRSFVSAGSAANSTAAAESAATAVATASGGALADAFMNILDRGLLFVDSVAIRLDPE